MAKNDKKVKRGVYLYIDGKEIKDDTRTISEEVRKLTKDIKDMQRGTEEYNHTAEKIRTLKAVLREHANDIKAVTAETKTSMFSFSKWVDKFNQYGGFIASMIASLTGLVLGLKALRDEQNKLEDSQASLKALTGLDDSSIEWLTGQAKVLSTTMTKEGLRVRQSADEILDAFMLVGSAKPELLGDKEALAAVTEEAMRLQAAAGDITLEQAVDSLTLALNQYGAEADQAARFTNVLAAGSQAGSANIASQASAIRNAGVAAASANVPIEQTVALIETLAYSGIKDEVAGTALKKFFLVLQTGADETNPKIVGLDKALENLKNKQMTAAQIKNMFGEEGYNAASVILQNTEMVKQYTEAVTGTNVAVEQAAINSDTASARMAQVRNEMKLAGIELINKLNPAILVSTNAMTYVVKILPGLIDWLKKWSGEIIIIGSALLVYATHLRVINLYTKTLNTLTKTAATLKISYAVAVSVLSGNLTGANKILRTFSGSMLANQTIVKSLTAVSYLYAAAVNLLHGNVTKASQAIRIMWATLAINPFTAVLAAVTAVASGIYFLVRRIKEMNDVYKELKKQTSNAQAELKTMYDSILEANTGTKERIELIKEFNSKYGGYLDNLLSEKSTVDEITRAYNRAAVAIKAKIAQEILSNKTTEIYSKGVEKQADILNDISEVMLTRLTPSDVQNRMQVITSFTEKMVAEGKSAQQIALGVGNALYKTKQFTAAEIFDIQKYMRRYAKSVAETAEEVKSVQDKLNPFLPQEKKKPANELDEVVVTPKSGSGGGTTVTGTEDKKKKKENQQLVAEEKRYQDELAQLKRTYLDSDIMSREEYQQMLTDLEMKHLDRQLEIAGLEPEKRQEINRRLLDLQIQLKEACIQEDKEEKKTILSSLEKSFELELKELERQYRKRLITREEYLQQLDKLDKKYRKKSPIDSGKDEEVDEYLKKVDTAIENSRNALDGANKTWRDIVDENWRAISQYTSSSEEQIKGSLATLIAEFVNFHDQSINSIEDVGARYEMIFGLMMGVAQQFGQALGKTLAGDEDAMDEFLNNMVVMVLDTIEKLMVAYIAESTMRNIGSAGLFGLITAAAESALITAAFETAKAAIGGFASGGYTGPGDWDEPKGLVHANEFVSNRFAVSNPNLRPIFDLIDYAQRTGTVSRLTGDDVAAVVSSSQRTTVSNVTGRPSSGSTSTRQDPATTAMLSNLSSCIRKLSERLDEPFLTVNSVTGKQGMKQAQDEYNKLMNNKSRHRS